LRSCMSELYMRMEEGTISIACRADSGEFNSSLREIRGRSRECERRHVRSLVDAIVIDALSYDGKRASRIESLDLSVLVGLFK